MKPFAPLNVLTLTALAGCVNAHGYIAQPLAKYKPDTIYTNYNLLTNASVNKGFAGGIYNGKPEDNAKQFTEHWPATRYTSLREMLDPLSPGYGFSICTGNPVDVSGYTEMWWQNNELKQGFLHSHHGPCEGWTNHTRLFHYDDCAKTFRSFPAKIPVDYSSCKAGETCLFVFYWLAVHSPQWQIYKQCVPITIKGSSGKGATPDITVLNDTPSTTLPATPSAISNANSDATPEATPPIPLTTDFTSIKTTTPVSTPATVTSSETQDRKLADFCNKRKRRMQVKSE